MREHERKSNRTSKKATGASPKMPNTAGRCSEMPWPAAFEEFDGFPSECVYFDGNPKRPRRAT